MGLGFLYEEKEDTVKILRCFGGDGPVTIPEKIDGKLVTELGDYIFSDQLREGPKGLYWEEESSVQGSGESRAPLCGDRIQEVTLPPALLKIGRYAFYCCDKLRTLKLTCTIRDIGAGAFNSCRKITCLKACVVKGEKSCLKEILSDLNETLTVEYQEMERRADNTLAKAGFARLLFPVFYEEAVENTPARILQTQVHGCGHRYRYCFQGTDFKFREYDSLFSYATACEEPSQAAAIAVGRLRFPLELTDEYRTVYEAYLMENVKAVSDYLTEKDDMTELAWFLSYFSDSDNFFCDNRERGNAKGIKVEHAPVSCLGNEGLTVRAREEYNDIRKPVLGETGYDKLIEDFSRSGKTDAVSLLMDARYRACPPKKRRLQW